MPSLITEVRSRKGQDLSAVLGSLKRGCDSEPITEDFPDELIPGSAGHPELCRRPCIFLATGRCAAGIGCKYCHEPHGQAIKLRKSIRIALQKLDAAQRLQIVHSTLARKRPSFPAHLPPLDHLLGIVEEELARLSGESPAGSTLQQRLLTAVRKLPVAAVLGETITAPMLPAFHARLQSELKRLRLQCAV